MPAEKHPVVRNLKDAIAVLKKRKQDKARGPGPEEAHVLAGALLAAEAAKEAQAEEPAGNNPGSGAEERQMAEKLPTPEKSDQPEKATQFTSSLQSFLN